MDISKRFAVLIVLAGINLIFAVKNVSLATPGVASLSKIDLTGSMAISDGAVLAKSSFPDSETSYYIKPKKTINVTATAYSSSVDETDDTPFITASGSFVRHGVVASNFLPLGTKFIIKDAFENTIFTVEDRMNSRYNDKKWIDIWFETKNEAKTFGRQVMKIEIL